MKNALNYYYGLDVSNIHQKDKNYYFDYLDGHYMLVICYRDNINDIYTYTLYLHSINFPCHEIILNNSNNVITQINNENYILMRVTVPPRKININDIILFSNINYIDDKLKLPDWYLLWTEKVDYLEYQMNQMGKKHHLLRESFSYYIGLAENAISLVKNVSQDNYALCHSRIRDDLQELYNPLNFVIDTKYRDVCEYYKNNYFGGKIDFDIKNYIDRHVYNFNDACLFFARLLFPTYYFDIYEKIINDMIDDSILIQIINQVNNFELVLKDINLYLRNKFSIPTLDWLIR